MNFVHVFSLYPTDSEKKTYLPFINTVSQIESGWGTTFDKGEIRHWHLDPTDSACNTPGVRNGRMNGYYLWSLGAPRCHRKKEEWIQQAICHGKVVSLWEEVMISVWKILLVMWRINKKEVIWFPPLFSYKEISQGKLYLVYMRSTDCFHFRDQNLFSLTVTTYSGK